MGWRGLELVRECYEIVDAIEAQHRNKKMIPSLSYMTKGDVQCR